MHRTRLDADAQLDASLRRIRGALEVNRNQYAAMVEQIMAATGAVVAERVTERMAESREHYQERLRRRAERRKERARRKASDVPSGIVFAVAAVACFALAVRTPGLFWLIFVGLGFGMTAASTFARAARRRREDLETGQDSRQETVGQAAEPARAKAAEPAPVVPAEPPDPMVARIQGLCDRLLADLEAGPAVVREVVTEPKATIAGLRQACLEIARRERELRSVLASQEETALAAEREALAARIANERDAIVRERLGQALRALDEKLAHRGELATAAARLDAENTRILYTLENLHMQLLRARSTDVGAPELGSKLRESLRELGSQIDAVAEALEFASTPVGADTGASPAAAPAATADAADADRAEKLAAARRAAQAQQAQRR